ncbi:macrolide ABC transporter ATP-binding protein [Cohnella sp. CIP 111063]|uniref:ABC transporter ATP-binding protein n=1 Tax=unclassified Cohnella TaxID=2636738 RepID=UPI000B8C0C26|nr:MULTISPECIES: ABC transporter ATP-binding protein [unclassified Cohnella]OXS56206.1 macrolide ABC transporter ATP-binding protein [Cohnella sp. CIP 111063]PRX67841.1 putative ABC transport system ATP-binding protein [Cohnella sp. SGD-V74]
MASEETADGDIIRAEGIKRVFGRGSGAVTVLKDVDIRLSPGRLVALKGRSGSGKTTLINLLSALDQPTEGKITFDGRMLTSMSGKERDEVRRKEMGLIFQSFALIPLMSAYENVEFVLRVAGYPAQERKQAAVQALERVGLKQRMHHRPFELSGGEQQRTAIARAIAHKPKLILADEPTAELDSRTGLQIIKVFRDLVEHSGVTIALTTHDPAIMEIVDQVYELEDGQIVSHS